MLWKEEIPLRGRFDVLVAGGGLAGVAAAVTAARAGKSALLIEKSVKLGGLATLGLINLFVPMCNGRGRQIIFGMAEELLRLSVRYGYGGVPKDFVGGRIPPEVLRAYAARGQLPPRYATRFSPEIFALALTDLCVRSGVTLLFDTAVCAAVTERRDGRDRVTGVLVENKSGRGLYEARQFVDATGDGDLMARAGLPTVERGNFHTYMGLGLTLDSCERAVRAGDVGAAFHYVAGGSATLYGEHHPDGLPLYRGTQADEVNRYLVCNQLELLERLKAQDRRSRDVAILPGMCQFRTTRRMDADYALRTDDAYRHFDDSIAAICDFDRRDFLYEVPLRALTRTGWENLITAGRTAAGEGYAWDVLRVIPPAILTGQAAGLACAHAIDEGAPVYGVRLSKLQSALERQNVVIHFDDALVPAHSDATHKHND